MYLRLKNFLECREEGQALVEYALIIALVSVLLIGALTGLKNSIATAFTSVEGSLNG